MNFIQRAQQLAQQAAALKQAVQTAPPKIAQMREVVAMTAQDLQQIRSDVQANINGLRSNSEGQLVQAMQEVDQNNETFLEAGYALMGMDLDLASNQRLAIHLDRVAEVPVSTHRALFSKVHSATIKSILAGIMKAEEISGSVELTDQFFAGLVVHVGPLPAVRMCWRSTAVEAASPAPSLPVHNPTHTLNPNPPPLPQAPAPSAPAYVSSLGLPAPQALSPISIERPIASTASSASIPSSDLLTAKPVDAPKQAWTADALDRFKKMPGVSKYRS